MNIVLHIVAIVLFLVAALQGGAHADAADLTAFGLAAFAAGHIVPGGWWAQTPPA